MNNSKSALKYFYKYLRPHWKAIFWVTVFSLISTFLQVLAPTYLGKAVTKLTSYVANGGSISSFLEIVAFLAASYLLSTVAIFISWVIMSNFTAHANNSMRKNLFNKLQRMPIRYFDTHQDGKILSLFTSDLDNIFNAMNQAIFELIAQVSLFIGTIYIMFKINVKMALFTVMTLPLALILALVLIKKARKYIGLQQKEISNLNGFINEQLNGQAVIITNGLQKQSVQEFKEYNKAVRNAMFKGQFYSGILFPLMNGLATLNFAIVIAGGTYLILTNQVSMAAGLGLMVMFIEYSYTYFQPLTQLSSLYNLIELALTGAKRLAKVEREKEEKCVSDGKELTPLKQGLALEDVHFGYNKDKEILHGINISVPKGKTVAVVGPTGSGKTTIMNLVNRFYDVDSGRITIDGTDIRKFTIASLRNSVGIVLQESVVFSGTVFENIAFGKQDATLAEVEAAAKKAQIHDYILSLPKGYETEISENGDTFSTGQKQLISIARTLLTDPDFLILDEATSNVDTVTEEKIQVAMDEVVKNRTSFVIAHRLKTIINADKIVVLKDGTVLEEGSHKELLNRKGFYYKLYTDQMVLD